ncbi:MAG: hypothetical protein JW730_18330 [Anaerolineales bacterium]|nr:hypothetical protein [Anaerolineales bacterium]
MKFELKATDEGWVLTIDNTNWVYRTLKQALAKIEAMVTAPEKEEVIA